jgi:hypothetical protein
MGAGLVHTGFRAAVRSPQPRACQACLPYDRMLGGGRMSVIGNIAEMVSMWLPRRFLVGPTKQFAASCGVLFSSLIVRMYPDEAERLPWRCCSLPVPQHLRHPCHCRCPRWHLGVLGGSGGCVQPLRGLQDVGILYATLLCVPLFSPCSQMLNGSAKLLTRSIVSTAT